MDCKSKCVCLGTVKFYNLPTLDRAQLINAPFNLTKSDILDRIISYFQRLNTIILLKYLCLNKRTVNIILTTISGCMNIYIQIYIYIYIQIE